MKSKNLVTLKPMKLIDIFNTEKHAVIIVRALWKSTGILYLVSDLAIFDKTTRYYVR